VVLTKAAIATNRFGLGARPDEPAAADPRRWLLGQFDRYDPRPALVAAQPATAQLVADLAAYRAQVQPMRREQADAEAAGKAREMAQKAYAAEARDDYQAGVAARVGVALTTEAPFVERLVHFWSNHFAISADKQTTRALGLAYEAEAIRPHVLGRFGDMLLAVERHAAMQLYLDQARSVGPNSPQAQRAARRAPDRELGLNENLAREILELHTLGVRTGYTQADVTEFARALTGWSVGGVGSRADGPPGGFVFRPQAHEPGARTVLGRAYAQGGEQQARAILTDLAASPATARHISLKLARHFVADEPPPPLVDRLTATYLKTGGDLPALYRTLVDAPEAWAPTPAKFKTPWDWLISSLRGFGLREPGRLKSAQLLIQLGQATWRPGSPAGFDDLAASWAAPEALVRRVELSQRLASVVGDRLDARTLADRLLSGGVSAATRAELDRAESPRAALALLIVSPEFLRR
jgi:uncharacterized protein (DUF1800 family)